MAYDYEEEKKAQSTHSPSKSADISSASSSSAAQLPAWAHGANSRVNEEERTVRQWLNKNVEKLGHQSLTLSQLVQCVLDSVPGAVKLSRVQIETLICEWATDHNITVLRTMSPPSGHSSTAKSELDEKGHKKKA